MEIFGGEEWVLSRFKIQTWPREWTAEIPQNLGVLLEHDPKSVFYRIPETRRPVYALAALSCRYVPTPLRGQLVPAKRLIAELGFERACRAAHYFGETMGCSLWWIWKHLPRVREEFQWA